jgi:hypothetical protein
VGLGFELRALCLQSILKLENIFHLNIFSLEIKGKNSGNARYGL